MRLRHSVMAGAHWLGVALLLTAVVPAAPAAGASPGSTTNPVDPGLVIEGIRREARHMNRLARKWDNLTLNADARWPDYDRQWLKIQPLAEDIGRKLNELRGVQAYLTPDQRDDVSVSRMVFARIQASVHDLRWLLQQPGITLTNPGFRIDSMTLAHQSRLLSRTI